MVGARDLERKLGKLEKRTQGQAMRESLKSALEPAEQLAKNRVPVGFGRLKKSIKRGVSTSRGSISAVIRTGTRKQLRIPQSAKYYYPAALEYGTRFIAARSFLRSALSDRRELVLGRFSRKLRSLLESIK